MHRHHAVGGLDLEVRRHGHPGSQPKLADELLSVIARVGPKDVTAGLLHDRAQGGQIGAGAQGHRHHPGVVQGLGDVASELIGRSANIYYRRRAEAASPSGLHEVAA